MHCPLAVERGLRTRATIVDRRGRLNIRQWEEETASAAMGHVWFADCESLFAQLISLNTKQVDNKRPAIDLSALKQLIWDNRDDCDAEVDGLEGRLSSLDRHVRDAVRSLNEDDDFWPMSTGILDMRPH